MQYYKTTHKISVIVCNAFCNGFVLYSYYQHRSKSDVVLIFSTPSDFLLFPRKSSRNLAFSQYNQWDAIASPLSTHRISDGGYEPYPCSWF